MKNKLPKLPKYIQIANDKVKLAYDKDMESCGMYKCDENIIKINPKTYNIGGCLLHEIMEFIAASTYAIGFEKKDKYIQFWHSPETERDTWTMFIDNLIDTIRRNNLTKLIFGGK